MLVQLRQKRERLINSLLVEVCVCRFTKNLLNETPFDSRKEAVSHAIKEINGAYQADLGK